MLLPRAALAKVREGDVLVSSQALDPGRLSSLFVPEGADDPGWSDPDFVCDGFMTRSSGGRRLKDGEDILGGWTW